MNKTFTFEQIAQFSEGEIDRFIDDFLINGDHSSSPGQNVIRQIMYFSKAFSNPLGRSGFPGIIDN
ncbi:MAG: hypothetical protein R6U19_00805 [Bacteroidales bacterium]